ncbi:aquaporin family protein [Flavobacteriaceae bacterium]|jgi:glycerol uptake facilitator protein|nr:aquaporin family protein [Flavobacteriaceae bacterium]MDA7711579.1 aquaporin family protein [Flavobacteriaceae bacterium]
MILHPFLAEFIGTAILLLLGAGVVANINLKNTIAEGQTPWVLITSAWGFAVFVAVYISSQSSGAHLNPAVTLGLYAAGKFSLSLVPGYLIAQLLGAMTGSWLAYLTYIDHYKMTTDENAVRSTFCTGPAIRNLKNNFFSEAIGTFMLVFGALFIVGPNIDIAGTEVQNFGIGSLDALPVGILVWVIGIALGGTTGYAINPARDLGPRIVYQLLPRKNKNADWGYAWVPVLGPVCGGIIAGLLYVLVTTASFI